MKILKYFLCLLALGMLLCSCKQTVAKTEAQQPDAPILFTRNGATLELPTKFFDYSESPIGVGHSFLYGSDVMGIMGDQYIKTRTESESLESFVQSQAELHRVQATQKDGFWTITYDDPTQNEPQIYICVFYETQSSYWIVSAYCPDRMFEDCCTDMWNYATNVLFY